MPELPEVETIVRDLAPRLEGRRITQVQVREWRLRERIAPTVPRALRGRPIRRVGRRGKAIVLELEAARCLVVQLGMTGRVTLHADGGGGDGRHDHVRLRLDDGGIVVFSDPRRFGRLVLVEASAVDAVVGAGTDPTTPAFTAEHLRRLIRGRRCAIKSLLMDQRTVTGIGNIYANEILFHAGIRPRRQAHRLTRAACAAIVHAGKQVLHHAIACGGSTISDYRDGLGRFGSYQRHHHVYDRAGQPCRVCGTPVRACRIVGRSSFYCPRCQR